MMTTTTTFVAQEGFLTGVTIFGVGEILSFWNENLNWTPFRWQNLCNVSSVTIDICNDFSNSLDNATRILKLASMKAEPVQSI
jgi:hypothetical protein